jgi:hypothetical protein
LTATGGPNQAASREEIMKTATKLLGLTVACATCCGAFPAVVPMLAAVGFASIGTAAVGWAVGLTALAVAAVVCIAVAVRPPTRGGFGMRHDHRELRLPHHTDRRDPRQRRLTKEKPS